jgi:hypothetical protein
MRLGSGTPLGLIVDPGPAITRVWSGSYETCRKPRKPFGGERVPMIEEYMPMVGQPLTMTDVV